MNICYSFEKIEMTSSVYLAGKWANRAELSKIADMLFNDHDIIIASTWTKRENGNTTPNSLGNDATRDIKEVCLADKLFVVMDDPKYAYRGTFSEIGCALGLDKPIVILCPGEGKQISTEKWEYSHYCMTNVFFWHPNIAHVKSIEEAVIELKK